MTLLTLDAIDSPMRDKRRTCKSQPLDRGVRDAPRSKAPYARSINQRNDKGFRTSERCSLTSNPLPTALATLLALHRDTADTSELGKFEERISAALENASARAALASWLTHDGRQWALEHRSGLAAVIEAAAKLAMPEVAFVLEAVLQDSTSCPIVVAIAAQRARWIHIEDVNLRRRIGQYLIAWIKQWAAYSNTLNWAALAIPSVPTLLGESGSNLILEWLSDPEDTIAWAAAVAALEWANSSTPPSDRSAVAIYSACRIRLSSEKAKIVKSSGPDLTATLVWLTGSIASRESLPEAAKLLVGSFRNATGLEDATAIRATRKLIQRFRADAIRAIVNAWGSEEIDKFYRFMALVVIDR